MKEDDLVRMIERLTNWFASKVFVAAEDNAGQIW
jgi:hypothetical protein